MLVLFTLSHNNRVFEWNYEISICSMEYGVSNKGQSQKGEELIATYVCSYTVSNLMPYVS